MNPKNLNVQATTCFELRGVFLVSLFPSITKGFTPVVCGEEKDTGKAKVIHSCLICKAYGHQNCPYVQEAIRMFMIHKKKKFRAYSIKQYNIEWKNLIKLPQIPVPSLSKPKPVEKVKEYEYSS
ncbi:hypothetical protein H0266_18325 [Halobacillus locisalis]|uniref:Uncharacterized protein n=1 Tax=Halobacillus locisalis TaxID=220753 RepID=A0A838CYC3_9BACI|nr:hypothetical protein [Halobacillus locisalis]MBA2176839.1 hypothetical protein [Halobacillus locisalis]